MDKISLNSTHLEAYDAIGQKVSIKEQGAYIPFVVTRQPYGIKMLYTGTTHKSAGNKARGTKLGGGSVVRERSGKLNMHPKCTTHGELPPDLVESVRAKIQEVLGEELTVCTISDFKGRRKE